MASADPSHVRLRTKSRPARDSRRRGAGIVQQPLDPVRDVAWIVLGERDHRAVVAVDASHARPASSTTAARRRASRCGISE